MKTVAEIVRWRARQHPEQVALWHQGHQTTYRELDLRSNRVANALIRDGLQPGQRVCVLDKGHDQMLELMFGIAKAGGVFTPVNWRLAPPEVAFVVEDAASPFLFFGEAFADCVGSIRAQLSSVQGNGGAFGQARSESARYSGDNKFVRWGKGARGRSYEEFLDGASESDPRRDGGEDDAVWQLYTSGTTGHPKGAELTHRNLCETIALAVSGFGGIMPGDVGLVCMPLYHIGGSGYALTLLFAGATLIVTREANPAEILELIPRHRINHAFLVPALLNFLLQQPACRGTDFASLKAILYGASPIPEELLKASIATFGCQFIQAYGLTETTGAVVLLAAREHVAGSLRLRACGLPTFGTELKIVDEAGNELAPGHVGEIVIKGPAVMKGYWNRPEATAAAIRDGWFYSGDAGYLDRDGFLYIHDRVKDMIVSGGENIYPAEVESVLFGHPAVADVAVIGVPDEQWGESVKAIVVRKPGATLQAEELMQFCAGKLGGYKRPRSVEFVEALPRNPTGKILKRELREKYWVGKQRRVN